MPVFLFPGQGAQFTGMGMDLYEADTDGSCGVRDLFALADAILGKDIREILSSDAENLKRTDVSQVAITVASLAAFRALRAKGILPSACAGFSLGEYPALAVSGVVSEEDAIRLTVERGRIMQQVADELSSGTVPAGMAAVLGLSPDMVDRTIETMVSDGIIDGRSLFAANYNSPTQTVVSGTAEALTIAEAVFKAAGARRVIRLKIAGPFHSPFMAKAGELFARVLEPVAFSDPLIPLFSNVTGARIASGADAKKCAVAHISNPVRWTDEENAISSLMAAAGSAAAVPATATDAVDLVEVGPGKVLSGLWADSKLAGTCRPYTELP